MSADLPTGMLPLPDVDGVDVRHRWVDVDGLRMHVAEAGEPEGDPLVLLHGWPQHWWCWRDVIGPLAERHRVICPDLRGFGWSDAPPGPYDKEQLVTDVLALLDALDLPRVKLAGHDWGGWVGFLLGLRAPERFERYLALNIATPWPPRDLRTLWAARRFWYQVVVGAPLTGPRLVASRKLLPTMLHGSTTRRLTDAEVEAFAAPLREPARALASSRLYRTFLTRELPALQAGRYRKARLHVPTLLLFGEDDVAIRPALLRGADAHADDLRVELVAGCGHFIAEERPALVAERALRFFAGG